MNGEKITREEMIDMFGEDMPTEAISLLWNTEGDKTLGEMRDELRVIGRRQKAARAIVGILSQPIPEAERSYTPYDQAMASAGRIYDAIAPDIIRHARNEVADLLDNRAEQTGTQGRQGQQIGAYFAALASHLRGESHA